MYNIQTHKRVDKFLAKHPDLKISFFSKFETIAQSPFKNNCDTKTLQGKKNHYRLRIGKYRFLYTLIDTNILIYIYDADSRGDIYE